PPKHAARGRAAYAIVKPMHRRVIGILVLAAAATPALFAQDRLKSAPGYERAQRFARESPTAVRGGNLAVAWTGSDAFEYIRDGKRFHFDVASRATWEVPVIEASARGGRGGE